MALKIGIFPASGGLGTSTINHLSKLVPASQLTLIARSPERLNELKNAGATIRHADYDHPNTLIEAFNDIDTLFLISYASFEIEHRVHAHKRAIDAALRSGVKHIFYSSLAFGGNLENNSVAHVMGAHLATERYLAELSTAGKLTYTAIREGLYSESFPIYTAWFDLKDPVEEVTIPHSGSGPGVAWAKRDELGEATAKLIVSYMENPQGFTYLNKIILLSGPRVISLQETVDTLSRAVGKPIRIREISVDEYTSLPHHGTKHTYHGVDLSREWTSAWDAIKRGETAVASPTLKEILGREPEDYETTIRNMVR